MKPPLNFTVTYHIFALPSLKEAAAVLEAREIVVTKEEHEGRPMLTFQADSRELKAIWKSLEEAIQKTHVFFLLVEEKPYIRVHPRSAVQDPDGESFVPDKKRWQDTFRALAVELEKRAVKTA